ncbi:2TM domain-containing protein [Flavobacterium pectinovorum]|uniref:2TM domain-containing protein n=1 Tax=Flavobacterium pectinovorum TaxID=29533 RepID=UPI001FABBB35|nr:2TM domain-containing protein [Flavobacterium pectinovorum]MCI9844770.1 2TM domain-containing protein [Flavobacterium pectinovorum]
MEKKYAEADRYYEAQKKVKQIREFYEHLTVFVLVNPIVIAVNLMTSPGYLWFVWCLMGWGVGVVLHGLKAFEYMPFFDKKWEERKIQEILEKEKNKQTWE